MEGGSISPVGGGGVSGLYGLGLIVLCVSGGTMGHVVIGFSKLITAQSIGVETEKVTDSVHVLGCGDIEPPYYRLKGGKTRGKMK